MVNWLSNLPEWLDITVKVFGSVSMIATTIALATPSPKDDRVASNLQRIGRDADRIGIAVKPIIRSIVGLLRTK